MYMLKSISYPSWEDGNPDDYSFFASLDDFKELFKKDFESYLGSSLRPSDDFIDLVISILTTDRGPLYVTQPQNIRLADNSLQHIGFGIPNKHELMGKTYYFSALDNFEASPYFGENVRLRDWDISFELVKVSGPTGTSSEG